MYGPQPLGPTYVIIRWKNCFTALCSGWPFHLSFPKFPIFILKGTGGSLGNHCEIVSLLAVRLTAVSSPAHAWVSILAAVSQRHNCFTVNSRPATSCFVYWCYWLLLNPPCFCRRLCLPCKKTNKQTMKILPFMQKSTTKQHHVQQWSKLTLLSV